MHLAENSFFMIRDNFVFSAWSYGYYTYMQNVTYDVNSPQFDTHLFNWYPFKHNYLDLDCFYKDGPDRDELERYENVNTKEHTKLFNQDNVFEVQD